MHEIKLPHKWIVYLYDKTAFRQKIKGDNKAKPNTAVCTLITLNDLIYFLQLMESPIGKSPLGQTINLDANDYIIMREGIEPVWEDPKNANGGTFTMKVPHDKGYEIWSTIVMRMIGETLSSDMKNINGITSAFMHDVHNTSGGMLHTYIKIWDGKSNRDKEEFMNTLHPDIITMIESTSLQYLPNNQKRHFGQRNSRNSDRRVYGGFR